MCNWTTSGSVGEVHNNDICCSPVDVTWFLTLDLIYSGFSSKVLFRLSSCCALSFEEDVSLGGAFSPVTVERRGSWLNPRRRALLACSLIRNPVRNARINTVINSPVKTPFHISGSLFSESTRFTLPLFPTDTFFEADVSVAIHSYY